MSETDRAYADFEWCIHSPALIREAGPGVFCPSDSFWNELAAPLPATLPAPPDPHRFRLGYHFEALVSAWAGHAPGVNTIARNVQVFAGKRTLGEFDLLLKRDGRTEHWELAVKFFLAAGDPADPSRWFGPNTSDRFDLKFNRMRDHQLTLSDRAEAAPTLSQLGADAPAVAAMVKGRLFHPFERFAAASWTYPDSVNPNHCRGWWIDAAQVDELNHLGQTFVWLPKSLWLAPVAASHRVQVMDIAALRAHVAAPRAQPAEQFAVLDEAGNETSRGFVVSPTWIERTKTPQG